MRPSLSILTVLLVVTGAYAQPASDLRVVSENSTSLVIEFTPRYSNRIVAGADGRKYTLYDFRGAAFDPGEPGSPLAPYRPVLVNLPSHQYSVQVVGQDYDDVSGVNIATQPVWQASGEFGVSPVYSSPNQKFVKSEYVPQQVARLLDVGESRGLLLGTLRIYPIQVSLGRNQVRVYRRIVVRVDFVASGAAQLPASAFLKNQFPSEFMKQGPTKLQKVAGDSPLAQGDWYRMEVSQTGIYKIDQSFLTKGGISLSAIGNINSIRIFGNGGGELPEDLDAPRPNGLEEIPRLVVDKNGNGVLDPEDFVLFYGKSTRGWTYSPSEGTFHHYINHYTETSVYFLSYGGAGRGKNMTALPSTSLAGAYKPDDFQGKTFVEQELAQLGGDRPIKSGRQWVGESFGPSVGRSFDTYTTSLSGFVSSKQMLYRFQFFSQSTSFDNFNIQENGQSLGSVQTYPIDVSSITSIKAFQAPVLEIPRVGALPSDRSVLRMEFVTSNSAAIGWLDWFEVMYRRRFEAVGDLLLFTSPDTNATVEYTVSKFSSRDIYVFDVTQSNNVLQVTNLAFDAADASVVRFQAAQTGGSVREFAAVGPSGFMTPANVQKVTNSNLHGSNAGADFVIISPTEFLTDAQRLATYRQQHDQLQVSVVNINQIFNEFSSGMLDPMAIRDFLKYAQTTWTLKPHYVLLFGAGSFDYKNILKLSDHNWVPPYETLESNDQIATLASDDYFVFLDPTAQRISMAIGRLPIRSIDDAKTVVDKIIAYETQSPLDPWRNRITFAADDGLTTVGDDGSTHTEQAEDLAQNSAPNSFTKQKIYIVEYPTVNTSTGRTKPTANQAIEDAINQGTLVLNWTGHGNTLQWAHEEVFSIAKDFSHLNNKGKLFFLAAATCDFARYDDPSAISAGEQLILMPDRGAIAEVTSDRVVYSPQNAALNSALYQNLFQQDAQGRPVRLGDAMWETKQSLYGQNDQKHHLLADPTMRLALPRSLVSVDSVNGQNADSLVTVGALGKVKVNGSLKKSTGAQLTSVEGRAILEMYDAKRTVPVPEWQGFTFVVNGSLIYRGEVSVRNGAVEGIFPIPKDVSYGADRSRINLYAWNDTSDAAGYTENIAITGTAVATVDTVGPTMRIYFEDQSFRPGDVVGPDATMIVDLADSSGINTSTAGIGHKLVATLDGATRAIDLTNSYRGNLDTYKSGQARYQFSALPEGRHTIAVKAWDIYNNASSSETYFEVHSTTQLSIYNVFNVPNPFARNTTFTFQRSTTDPIDVEIKIYTVAGRLIQTIESPSVIDRFVEVRWDGRDRDGNELANGVYLYRVIAKSLDGSSSSESLGKLAVLR